ncbi:unnamed protein product (macronuclear) [Paramecium tetraurelia]|uniref:Uncharacterized protein n=1 Tax=Paramecium tetraurelia TaxID=5888 RepID=A0CG26_PARTE|nr:uncharacterized protein GSPATT00038186001 [Paramecium tetraurelia]CAK69743.1 unnamed protein product [Paramecium tetraurelia]|eukprot:XP_001437140.1 hypothetical protein (macronuclear) [Paramecium tetraurelia strain d4-2]
MNFLLYAGNFEMELPIPFQTNDQSAKAKEMFDYLSQGFQGQNVQIGFQLQDGQQGYLDPAVDLKSIYDANAQLFIMVGGDQNVVQNELQNPVAGQGVPVAGQGVPVNTFVADFGENRQIAQEYADPNLSIGQYVIQLGLQYGLTVETNILYDHEGNQLTDDQNQYLGSFMNYPFLNLVLTTSQQIIQNNPQNQNKLNSNPIQSPIQQQPRFQNDPQPNLQNLQPVQALQPAVAASQQVGLPVEQRIQQVKDSVVTLKNMTLYFDPSGEFITYQYHHPIQVTGSIKKSQTTSNQKFSNSKNTWSKVHNNKFEIAQLDEYSFGIKWEGGNSSRLRIKQQ